MIYVDLVMALNFAVDLLLLVGTNGLSGYPPGWKRALGAALLGGLYGGICLIPEFRFLGSIFWRVVFLALMSAMAFGWNVSALRRGILFVLLSMALSGIAIGLGDGRMPSLIGAAAAVALLCLVGFRGKAGACRFCHLELVRNGRSRALTALCDTGNTLRDPVTGRQVIVVGAAAARELAGLTAEELSAPLETLARSGRTDLRLIPYRSVGCAAGLLLGVRMDEVWLDGRRSDHIVAFAPEEWTQEGYEALVGGMA